MDNIVLDTNCLLMCVSSKNKYHRIWQSFLAGDFVLCVSNEIIEEYHEVLARNLSQHIADAVLYTILTRKNVWKLDPHYHFHLITVDEDDNKFVDCAIAANAKCIVTEDKHFAVLKQVEFPKIAVMGIDEFVKMLSNRDN